MRSFTVMLNSLALSQITSSSMYIFFFGSGRGLNLRLCIFYVLSQVTELSSRGLIYAYLRQQNPIQIKMIILICNYLYKKNTKKKNYAVYYACKSH